LASPNLYTNLYTIGEVASLLGLSAHTIRAWERRHGIVHPERTATRQRRYTHQDIELLRDVKRATEQKGFSLKLAFRAATGDVEPPEPTTHGKLSRHAERWALGSDTRLWRTVGDLLPQLILIIDREGKIVEVNVAVARTFGNVRQRFTDRAFATLVDPFDRTKATLLYRPQLRTVQSWELNMLTHSGARLYSFMTWPVNHGGNAYLALVGSQMYEPQAPRPGGPVPAADQTSADLRAEAQIDTTALSALEQLVAQLPFGVAVSTIGHQPRIVYGNTRLLEALGLPPGRLTGRLLAELIPNRSVGTALREAVDSRRSRTLSALVHASTGNPGSGDHLLRLAFRPLFSTNGKVTSVLVVVAEGTETPETGLQFEHLLLGERLRRPTTLEELAVAGLDLVRILAPGLEFMIHLTTLPGDAVRASATKSTPGWSAGLNAVARRVMRDLVARVTTTGEEGEASLTGGRSAVHVTSVPLVFDGQNGTKRRVGVVAWRWLTGDPMKAAKRLSIDTFLSQFALAAELFHLRLEVASQSATLESLSAAASVVRNAGAGAGGLAVRFLQRLTKALDADWATIGRPDGASLLILAAYPFGAETPARGDRFPLVGQFVSAAVTSGEPTATSRLDALVALPPFLERVLKDKKHGLAVPLVLDGVVRGVITLVRGVGAPFTQNDVNLVQALTSVGLLAVTLDDRR